VPFPVSCKFTLKVGEKEYTAKDGQVKTDGADEFVAHEEGNVKYRLYSPKQGEKRPMILFLHGGGERGYDNKAQVYNCFGAAKLAQSYPDVYVLAPQAPGEFNPTAMAKNLKKMTFATSDSGPGNGWTRDYLGEVCDIVRRMINEGSVDPERVYVTGMSMGGAGTLKALNVGGNLFAAAVPICPSMTPETYNILKGLTDTKVWVTCSYLDHTPYRHKYIVDAIMSLRDGGNKDAHLTMFAPEDLEKYGISILDDMTLEEKAGWNHACWVPTYYDEYGVMSWMMNQRKH
jgi:predicted peptidase